MPRVDCVIDATVEVSDLLCTGTKPGPNDVSRLSPGVYFVREQLQAASSKPQTVRKVVVTK